MDASLQVETVLEMQRIGKRFGQVWVLKNVNVHVRRGSVHAIVGHNGAGKSTLMKIALGAEKPTEGKVRVAGQELTYSRPAEARMLGLGMVMQERSLIRTLSGLDNLYLNAERKSALGLVDVRKQRAEIADLLEELAIPRSLLSTMSSDMSTIEQELIEIARALRLGSQVLILDEPTAPLGRDEITRLFGVLKMIAARGAGIVIITHHLAEVFAVSDMVTCLREGQVVLQTPTKDTNMAGLISAMLGRRPWEGSHLQAHGGKRIDARSKAPQKSEPSLKVRNLKVGAKLADVSFEAFRGEVLGVVGLAGSGRTTLLRALFGDLRQGGGEILFQDKRYRPKSTQDAMEEGVFLIPEDRGVHGLMLAKSIAENITIVILRRLSGLMGLLNFSEARDAGANNDEGPRRTRHRSGSDGERALGRQSAESRAGEGSDRSAPIWCCSTSRHSESTSARRTRSSPSVRAMADEGATILWASSDLLEVTHVADRIIVLRDGVVGATVGPEEADKFTEDALVAMMQRQQFEGMADAEADHVGG